MQQTPPFVPGQRWTSDTESDLGLGLISSVSGRMVSVVFPASGEQRTYAAANAPLTRLRLTAGETATSHEDWEIRIEDVAEAEGLLVYEGTRLDTGARVRLSEIDLSSFTQVADARSRILNGQLDSNRWFNLRLATRRRTDQVQGGGSYGLGGARISLIPHQLYIAHTVASRAAPRALLADEVGLGKTIEACLVLHKQLLTGRSRRALVIVPEALLHQWLVELLRRFNLRFKLFDEERCAAVQLTDAAINPFETEQLVLASLDLFAAVQRRTEALQAGWDLVILDEAHHIHWDPEAPSAEYGFIADLADSVPGLLLLTATPEQLGEESHFARLRLLDPERFTNFDTFIREQHDYQKISGIVDELGDASGAWPPDTVALVQELIREPVSTDYAADRRELLGKLIDRHGPSRVLFRNTRSAIEGFPERRVLPASLPHPSQYGTPPSGRTTEILLYPETGRDDWTDFDPRVRYLIDIARELKDKKILVICHLAETAARLEKFLRLESGLRAAVFHEGMSVIARDRAAHYFADSEGARILVCSEIGSEGRNFQFAHHLVLFDLPLHPDLLEQRIGRLDRIGQKEDVNIHVPYLDEGPQKVLFRWYHDGLNALQTTCTVGQSVFEETGEHLIGAIRGDDDPDALIAATRLVYTAKCSELEQGRDRLLEISSNDPEVSTVIIDSILAVEKSHDAQQYLGDVFDAYGVEHEQRHENTFIVRPGDHMHTPHFPHLKQDGMTVTFDRATALAHEDVEYLTWEHPMTLGAMDLVTTGDHGKAVVIGVEFDLLPRGSLLVETLHVLEIMAPNAPELRRFVGTSTCRMLRDENGRDLARLMDGSKLFSRVRDVENSIAKRLIAMRRRQISSILGQNEAEAATVFARTTSNARAALKEQVEKELGRLAYLRSVNASVRLEEIELLKQQREASLESLDNASARLDAVRLIVTL